MTMKQQQTQKEAHAKEKELTKNIANLKQSWSNIVRQNNKLKISN